MRFDRTIYRLIAISVSLCIIFSIFFGKNIIAEEEPQSLVDASFDIEYMTGTYLKIDVNMNVRKITVFDTVYTSEEIENVANNDLETMGAIKLRLRDLLKNQIELSFENAIVNALNDKPIYENSLFFDEFGINLTPGFFGINETVNVVELVNGVLDMGGVVIYDFGLQAELGWNNTFTYLLSDLMNLDNANTSDVDLIKNEIRWTLKNWNGDNPSRLATLSAGFKNPTTLVPETEDILIVLELDTTVVNNISLTTTIIAKNIDIRNYEILPDFISELPFVPSDGIRLFIDNDLLSWEGFYFNTIGLVENNTISTIENSSFNQTLDPLFSWNPTTTTNCSMPFNITNMNDEPAIEAELVNEDVSLLICDMSSRAFLGLVNAGASANISDEDVNFGDNFNELWHPYTVFLDLPSGIDLEGENTYSWNQSNPLSGEFVSELRPEPPYSKESIDALIEIDITKMDLNLASLITGKTEVTANSHIKEDENLYVIKMPEEFNISEKINMTYLNSDAFRLCTEEFVFGEEDIESYLTNKKEVFGEKLGFVMNDLEIKGIIDRDSFYESLTWDEDISNMDDVTPVVVSNYANNLYSIGINLSLWPPNIHISNQTFNLTGLDNKSVTYRIIFPNGIEIEASDQLNKSIIKGNTSDGREYVEISFDPDEGIIADIVLCELSASPLYIVGLFLPCILSFVLVVILVIIVLMIRKKRQGGKVIQEESEPTGYEGQDFYVPPPPNSK